MGLLFLLVGGVLCLVAWITFLIEAFDQHLLWGLGCLLLPIVQLIFLLAHWKRTKKPFLLYVLAVPFLVAGRALTR